MANKANVVFHVDISDAKGMIEALRLMYTKDAFHKIMYRVFQRAATKTKVIVKKEVPADYKARPGWIGAAFQPVIISKGASVSCTIPLDGARGRIGADGPFKVSSTGETGKGVRKAYEGRKGKRVRRRYKLEAQIVTAGTSKLPSEGKQPHFKVFTGKYKNRIFVRLDKKGKHIRPAVGVGVPQMPMNRTKDAVQSGVLELVKQRIEHEHHRELKQRAGKWM